MQSPKHKTKIFDSKHSHYHRAIAQLKAALHVGATGVYPIGSELLYTDKDDKEHKCIVKDIEECDNDTGTHIYRVGFPDGNYRSTTSRKLKRAPAKFEVGELVIYFPKYNVQKQREERKLVEITKKAYPDQRQLKQGGEDDNDSCWVYDIRECGKDGGRQDYYGIKEMDLKKSQAEVERKKKEEAEEAKGPELDFYEKTARELIPLKLAKALVKEMRKMKAGDDKKVIEELEKMKIGSSPLQRRAFEIAVELVEKELAEAEHSA